MFNAESFKSRRAELRRRVGDGLILIPGNSLSPYNYPNNSFAFRQDSTFRYLFGLNVPDMFGVLDCNSGEDILFGNDFTVDDIIWMGPQPTVCEQAEPFGIEITRPTADLQAVVSAAVARGRKVHFLPAYRGEVKLQLSELLGIKPAALHDYKSIDLMFAIVEMREIKSAEEIAAIQDAFHIGYKMHTTAMNLCRPGVCEREIAGALEGIARSMGGGVSFPSITSQHGETLHNINQDGILEEGRLFLCDAGGESLAGYCSDHTRTYPVSGKFTPLQRDIYNIVLASHDYVAENARPMMYQDLHDASQRILAQGLCDMGLFNGSVDAVMESGAIYMMMPHGLGHGLGMDVHDCEAYGERSFDFSLFEERAKQSGTCVHRKTWQLRPGTVLSDEPGLYFIPALIDKSRKEGLYKGIVNYDKLAALYNFGGIRIEDDLLITEDGCMMFGDKKIPASVEELESFLSR